MIKKNIEKLKSNYFPKDYNLKSLAGRHNREKPKPYLDLSLDILKMLNGNTIVEIGSSRLPMNHSIEEVIPNCDGCNGGHSTYVFSNHSEFNVHSCDIHKYKHLQELQKKCPNLYLYQEDGIEFLKKFEHKIDLLFLDGWDVGNSYYKEKSLEAFNTAQPKLSRKHLIVIDDTDLDRFGKGELVINKCKLLSYDIIAQGRQTILMN